MSTGGMGWSGYLFRNREFMSPYQEFNSTCQRVFIEQEKHSYIIKQVFLQKNKSPLLFITLITKEILI